MKIKFFYTIGFLTILFVLTNCPEPKKSSPFSNPLLLYALASSTSSSSASSTPTDISKYGRKIETKTYTSITGTDATLGSKVDLGFSFDYLGKKSTQATVDYGKLTLDGGVLYGWNTSSFTTGTISYLKESNKITFQFKDVGLSTTSTSPKYNLQIVLNGSDSTIEFIYGSRTAYHSVASSSLFAILAIANTSNSYLDGKLGAVAASSNSLRYGDFPTNGTSIKFTPNTTSAEFTDPYFSYQWHLKNTGQLGGTSGEDVNVSSVWTGGNKGEGIKVVVVDDGLDNAHEDLKDNILTSSGRNYLTSSSDPSGSSADHGTCVGGIIGARDGNTLGGMGVAPRASLFGYNLLQNLTTTNETSAMTGNGNMQAFDVSNNSWGAADNRGTYTNSNSTWRTAIDTGVTSGRSNKGAIYLWAAGNGGATVDNSNYDGQANYYGVMAIAAIGDDGKRANYSEEGANLWVGTQSQGTTGAAITTVDNTFTSTSGYSFGSSSTTNFASDKYTNSFNGTSAATPLAAGVVALMLKANSNLTWRDVRIILAETARKNDATDSDWVTVGTKVTGGSYNFNHKYGFGAIDANAAVNAARTWTNVATQVTHTPTLSSPGSAIPDNNVTGVSNAITVSASGINRIEFVEITLNSNHTYVGDLAITLTSPSGAVSTLSKTHGCKTASFTELGACSFPSNVWRFGSSRHMGEAANGNWTLRIVDGAAGDTGTFTSWNLKFYGR
ncbi:MAG: S8 family peptidase [Leptospiraceae bacterium]|nr:S8 family peptidase [Leptospiraceae bacterium]